VATVGELARTTYVRASRAGRTLADRTGVLGRLDRSYRRDRSSVGGHLRTLFAIHDVEDLVDLDVPWWTYPAIDIVEAHLASLDGKARVFEYGSGASTVWLGRRAAEVISVEHHPGFAGVMRKVLAEAGLENTTRLLEVPPVEGSRAPVIGSERKGEDGRDYVDYVTSIEQVEGEFDLVVVDGRARVACLDAAVRRLAPGALVLFDDSQRPRYHAGMAASGLRVRRLRGWAPSLPYPRESAVLDLPA
jgi:SAM-dependent methyltransferase